MINKFSSISGYIINLHKLITFLYTTKKHTEKELMDTLSVTIASKKIKYQRINQTKEVKDFYNESFKPLKKDKDTRKRKNIPCSWINRINFVKMAILLKIYLQIQCNPNQKLHLIFCRNRKTILKFIGNHKRLWAEKP